DGRHGEGRRRVSQRRSHCAVAPARRSQAAADQGRRRRVTIDMGLYLPDPPDRMLRSMFVMDEANDLSDEQPEALAIPAEPAPPIQSRFLFVDVAALRAKQLRRGARVRFDGATEQQMPKKAERLAMEEVRRGLVPYEVPSLKANEREAQE